MDIVHGIKKIFAGVAQLGSATLISRYEDDIDCSIDAFTNSRSTPDEIKAYLDSMKFKKRCLNSLIRKHNERAEKYGFEPYKPH